MRVNDHAAILLDVNMKWPEQALPASHESQKLIKIILNLEKPKTLRYANEEESYKLRGRDIHTAISHNISTTFDVVAVWCNVQSGKTSN